MLGGYVRGTAIVALVDAVIIGIALAVLQVPLAFPLALVVFVGAFIPLVGATIAGLLAVLVALVANGPVVALVVLAGVIGALLSVPLAAVGWAAVTAWNDEERSGDRATDELASGDGTAGQRWPDSVRQRWRRTRER